MPTLWVADRVVPAQRAWNGRRMAATHFRFMVQRVQAGVPAGGQFAAGAHAEADVSLEVDPGRAWLRDYRITGFSRQEYRAAPDAPVQPGGCCSNCGQALINVYTARNDKTGDTVTLGVDCAERAGLDEAQLKAHLRDYWAARRAQERQHASAEARRAAEAAEAAEEALHGPHGALGRYESGCRCGECRSAAPHGTIDRFDDGSCLCSDCVRAAVDDGRFEERSWEALIDASTGAPIDNARIVQTRYGSRWVVDDSDGGEPSWYPVSPKRRSTMASKGVLEARATYLVRPWRSRQGATPVARLTTPVVDSWGEPIDTPDTGPVLLRPAD